MASYAHDELPDKARIVAPQANAFLDDDGRNTARPTTEVRGGMRLTEFLRLNCRYRRVALNRQLLGAPAHLQVRSCHRAGLSSGIEASTRSTGDKKAGDRDLQNVDLTNQEAIQRPYPIFDALREELPVHWNHSLKGWFVSRYADVRAALMNPELSVEKMYGFGARDHGALQEKISFLTEIIGGWMVFKDPPRHTRLRKVMQPAFLPSEIEKLRPKVEAISRQLLEKAVEKQSREGRIDLIWDCAFPLPAIVVGELCGVPAYEAERLKYWADDIGKFVLQGRATPDKYDRSYSALVECVDFYRDLVARERAQPGDNLVARMIQSDGVDEPLSDDEIVSTLVLLLFAGHETTTNLIANGMYALMQNPDQLRLLQSDLSLVDNAVEEFLRFEGPAAVVVRIAKQPLEIGGMKIAEGERVFLGLNAADHDPAKFDAPQQLNVASPGQSHVAFGMGVHTCLGAPLARLEGRVAIRMLLENFTDFQVMTPEIEWRDELITRGLQSLPVSFAAQA